MEDQTPTNITTGMMELPSLLNHNDSAMEDMEMDFAKLFDPQYEMTRMKTEGSGWPTTSTSNYATTTTSSAPVSANNNATTVPGTTTQTQSNIFIR